MMQLYIQQFHISSTAKTLPTTYSSRKDRYPSWYGCDPSIMNFFDVRICWKAVSLQIRSSVSMALLDIVNPSSLFSMISLD